MTYGSESIFQGVEYATADQIFNFLSDFCGAWPTSWLVVPVIAFALAPLQESLLFSR